MNERALRLTSIARPVDRRYPTNRAIASLSLVAAILGFAIRRLAGVPSPEAFVGGISLAISFFLAWAVARELDPDHDLSAFLAAALVVVPHSLLGRPDFAGVLLVLLALRIVNRTVGPAARPLDTLGVLALAGLALWRGHVALALLVSMALALDAILHPAHRIHLAAAVAALAMLGVGLSRPGSGPAPALTAFGWLAMAATLPFLALVRASGTPSAGADVDGLPLSGARVRGAQLLGMSALFGSALIEGQATLASLSPLWAALVGTGVYFSIGAPTRLPHSVQDPS